MSHASLLVIGDDIETQMAPYDENTEVEPYKDRVELTADTWPGSLIRDEVPGFDLTDLKGFASWYDKRWDGDCDHYEVDEEGLYQWSTYNPQSRWDWWVIGGRFAGRLVVKPEVLVPEPNIPLNPFSAELSDRTRQAFAHTMDGRHTDSCLKGELDLTAMRADRVDRVVEQWEAYKLDVFSKGMKEEEARLWHGLGPEDTEEAMLTAALTEFPLTSFAVLAEGIWREVGRMGWFGMSSDTAEDRAQWKDWYERFMNGLPDEARLTIVDYHI